MASTPNIDETQRPIENQPKQKSQAHDGLTVGGHTLASRLIVGTGKYDTLELMRDSLAASGSNAVTVAVRRERMYDRSGQNVLDYIDPSKYLLLPNTAGCYSATDAVRVAKLGREILRALENPGSNWVKLEVLGDSKTLLPDPVATSQVSVGTLLSSRVSAPPSQPRRLAAIHGGGAAMDLRCWWDLVG